MITSEQIIELRDRTGCGMQDAAKMLRRAGGDMERAVEGVTRIGQAVRRPKEWFDDCDRKSAGDPACYDLACAHCTARRRHLGDLLDRAEAAEALVSRLNDQATHWRERAQAAEAEVAKLKRAAERCSDEDCGHTREDHNAEEPRDRYSPPAGACRASVETDEGWTTCGCKGFVDALDAKVQAWHSSNDPRPLHEFLGMTWEEYAAWVAHR